MPDVFSKKKRSKVMSCIRSKGNKNTELALIKLFRKNAFMGWRRHQKIFGKPDFVFAKLKLAIFVDGCFWHCCKIHFRMPKNNKSFWAEKFSTNQKRDRLVTKTLRSMGWKVLRIWEHELTKKNEIKLTKKIGKKMFFQNT